MRINYNPGRIDDLIGSGSIAVKDLTAMYHHTFPEGTDDKLIGPALRNSHAMHAFHLAFHRVAMRALHGVDTEAANICALRLFTLKLQGALTGQEDEIDAAKFWMGSEVQLSDTELASLLSPEVTKEAVLYGLHVVQCIDRGSLAWLEDGLNPAMKNPLIEARNIMDFIGEFITLPTDSIWEHTKKGTYYRILGGANQASNQPDKFPPMVIYQDGQRNTWARPMSEFLASFQHRYNLYNYSMRRPGQIEHGT